MHRIATTVMMLTAATPAAACELPLHAGDVPRLARPAEGPFIDGFGLKRHPVLGIMRPHRGIDIAGPHGTPVVATVAGEVVEARRNDEHGNWVRVRHGGGYEATYSHLSRYTVAAGDCVTAGQQVGTMGTTGLAIGPHLHFELWQAGQPIDPVPLMPDLGSKHPQQPPEPAPARP